MSFTLINKSFYLIISLFFLFSCSTKTVYEKIKIKKYEEPTVEAFDNSKIYISTDIYKQIPFENKFSLKNFKNDNLYYNNVSIKDDKFYAYNKNTLYYFNNTGDLILKKELNLAQNDDVLVSFRYFDDSFILAFKSGTIVRLNMEAEIIWQKKSDKTLNTQIILSNEQIILLFVDEIRSLSLIDGVEIWSETYEDFPIYQAKGGQLASFLNIIYFVLPNNSIGAIDLNLGRVHNSKFDEIPLVSSINNTKDSIYVFDKYLIYIDEGKYLYTLDIIKDDFIFFKKNINLASSIILFNNAIILKEGNYIQAINPLNGETYWLINNKNISKKSQIVSIRNYKNNIEIILSSGDLLTINNKELLNITDLNVGNINDMSFDKKNIIVYTESNKTIIF